MRSTRPSPPPRLERDARREARRLALLEAAVRVIRRDGPGATMEAIAAEAGVTKPILYRHFGDRQGLVDAVAQGFATELMDGLRSVLAAEAPDPRTVLVTTIDAYLGFVERDRELYRFLVARATGEGGGTAAQLGGFIREVSQQVAVVVGERLRAVGVDSGGAEPLAFGVVGMVHSAGDWWLESQSMTRPRLVDYLATLLWSGFAGIGLASGATVATTEVHS